MQHIATYYMVRHWADRISATGLSQALQNASWVVPTSQSIHIVSVSIVFASALLLNLRLLGVGRTSRSVSELTATLVPWIYGGLIVLLFTGSVQTIAEPERQFVTPAFWWKMVMIVCVLSLTIAVARAVRANPARWDGAATRPLAGRLFAWVSIGLWVAIICCGRFIGYTWLLHV